MAVCKMAKKLELRSEGVQSQNLDFLYFFTIKSSTLEEIITFLSQKEANFSFKNVGLYKISRFLNAVTGPEISKFC